MFNAPNEELVEKTKSSAVIYDADGSIILPPEDESGIAPYFEPYVAESYMEPFLAAYAVHGHFAVYEEGGKSKLESLEFENPKEETKMFTAKVNCTHKDGSSKTIEIKGSYREDGKGKIENIKFNSGYDEFLSYFNSPAE